VVVKLLFQSAPEWGEMNVSPYFYAIVCDFHGEKRSTKGQEGRRGLGEGPERADRGDVGPEEGSSIGGRGIFFPREWGILPSLSSSQGAAGAAGGAHYAFGRCRSAADAADADAKCHSIRGTRWRASGRHARTIRRRTTCTTICGTTPGCQDARMPWGGSADTTSPLVPVPITVIDRCTKIARFFRLFARFRLPRGRYVVYYIWSPVVLTGMVLTQENT
jgi:hypothetical protein